MFKEAWMPVSSPRRPSDYNIRWGLLSIHFRASLCKPQGLETYFVSFTTEIKVPRKPKYLIFQGVTAYHATLHTSNMPFSGVNGNTADAASSGLG